MKRIVICTVIALSVIAALSLLRRPSPQPDALHRGRYQIIVKNDAYGIPYRCIEVNGIGSETLHAQRASSNDAVLVSPNGYTIRFGAASTVIDLDLAKVESGQISLRLDLALATLGLDMASCRRIQKRRFDPAVDEYVGPEDDTGHGEPEDDREPSMHDAYHNPQGDNPPDADGL